jgi:hypothetical protein
MPHVNGVIKDPGRTSMSSRIARERHLREIRERLLSNERPERAEEDACQGNIKFASHGRSAEPRLAPQRVEPSDHVVRKSELATYSHVMLSG